MDIDFLSKQLETKAGTSRRQALKRLGLGTAGLAGLGFLGQRANAQSAGGVSLTAQDIAILQFALNLEYLEAQYYTYGETGHGMSPAFTTGSGTQGTVTIKANPRVPFTTPLFQQYATEIASDERLHVVYLRNVLSFFGVTPVAQPQIDLQASFNALAQAAGIGSSFDPFANEVNFLLGAYIFEDVGVTAYKGAAPLIANVGVLAGAAGVLGTEAYHAANIRTTLLAAVGGSAITIAQQISDLRDALDGGSDDDQGLTNSRGRANIVPTDSNARVFGRTTRQVLNILYFAVGASSGGFFPNGLNGPIR